MSTTLRSVLFEIRRRPIGRVALVYVIVGWLMIQVAVEAFPALQLPEWSATLVIGMVALFFPMAMVLAWSRDPLTRAAAAETAAPAAPSRRALPATRYARCGDLNIAFQVAGEGSLDVILVNGWVTHVEHARALRCASAGTLRQQHGRCPT